MSDTRATDRAAALAATATCRKTDTEAYLNTPISLHEPLRRAAAQPKGRWTKAAYPLTARNVEHLQRQGWPAIDAARYVSASDALFRRHEENVKESAP